MTSNVRDNLIFDSETNEFVPRKAASDNFADIIIPKTKANNNFKEKNKDLLDTIDKKYEETKDTELREKFESNDQDTVAAVAIACQRTKAKTIKQKVSNAFTSQAELDAEFRTHYDQALLDIKNKDIYAKSTNSYRNEEALEKTDQKIAAKKADKKKNNVTLKEAKVVGDTVECEKKFCKLTEFKIFETAKPPGVETIGSWLTKDGRLPMFKRAGNAVNDYLDKEFKEDKVAEEKPEDPLFDFMQENSDLPNEIHLVAGNLTHFERHFKITAQGECGHGLADICPTIKIKSDQGDYIKPLSAAKPYFHKSAKELKKFNMVPKGITGRTLTTVSDALSLLKFKPTVDNTQTYSYFVDSCQKHNYKDYSPAFVIHQPIVFKATTKFQWNFKKRGIDTSLELVGRVDADTYKCSASSAAEANLTKQLLGSSPLGSMVNFAGKALDKLLKLGCTDHLFGEYEDEYEDVVTDEDSASDAEEAAEAPNEFSCLPPCINVSYFMKRVDQPALNYSKVAYAHTMFISASPLLKWQKTISLKPLIFKKTVFGVARVALADVTTDLAGYALDAINVMDFVDNTTDSIQHAAILIRHRIVKGVKDSEHYKKLTSNSIVQGLIGPNNDEVTLEDCNAVAEDKSEGSSIKCDLTLSAAAESDDPSGGLVFTKAPGGSLFSFRPDSSVSTMYAGINLQLNSVLSSDMKIVKWMAFGYKSSEIKSMGVQGTMQSADKTGESRFGVTLRYLTKARQEKEKQKKIEAEADETIQYDQQLIDAPLGLTYQVFFSGLSIYIDGYIEFTKSETDGEGDASSEVVTPEETPAPSRRKKINTNVDDDSPTDTEAKVAGGKTLVNLRIIKARESKYHPIKEIISSGDGSTIAPE